MKTILDDPNAGRGGRVKKRRQGFRRPAVAMEIQPVSVWDNLNTSCGVTCRWCTLLKINGVYGLTKGQFSATAERGLSLKREGTNLYKPVDICKEAIVSNASFVARSFAGDPKQVKELIKAAINHRGLAVLDIISPCVTFNNQDTATHSYTWGKEHEVALHELSFVPPAEEIMVEYEQGQDIEVTMHDGSTIMLKKLERDYDPTDKSAAMH